MTWTRLVGQTLAAEVWGGEVWGGEVWGGEVCAVSGPTIVPTDAVAAIAASAAHLHAFHLRTLSSSCAPPRHATPPSGGRMSLADRFCHHHRQGDGSVRTCASEKGR
jgi:hypothetical protein